MPTEHRVYTDYAPLTSSEHTQLTRNVKLILCGKVPGRRRCPLIEVWIKMVLMQDMPTLTKLMYVSLSHGYMR